jgi:glycosyltransferase involved in cell wall biosynthesis
MRALLAMPAYNESHYLPTVLAGVKPYISDVLVVDDGSTDETPAILRETPGVTTIRHPTNMGYGQSLIDAFGHAIHRSYDWVITMDCDEQHVPEHIPDFLAAASRDDADIVSGSRYLTDMDGDDVPPAARRAINMSITALLKCQLGLDITDAFCGFKAYRVTGLKRLHPTDPGYAMPLQVWVQAARAGLRVREIPVKLVYKDPDRHFGGILDDPHARFMHYVSVLKTEMGGFKCTCYESADRCVTSRRIARGCPRCYS